MVTPTSKDDEVPGVDWFDDAVARIAAGQPFELSESSRLKCYDAAIRVMLNIPTGKIQLRLSIPETDINLLKMIFVADTNPGHPGILFLGQSKINDARRSYLSARGRVLWERAYGTMSAREEDFLQATVDASVFDSEPSSHMSETQTEIDPEFDQFQVTLSLLILSGQQKIMDEVRDEADDEQVLRLLDEHQAILNQQLQLLGTLKSMCDSSSLSSDRS